MSLKAPLKPGPILLCRSSEPPEPIQAGYTLGYSCLNCGKALQVTPKSVRHLEANGNPFCVSCGTAVIKAVTEDVKDDPSKGLTIEFTPTAERQMERLFGKSIPELFPNAHIEYQK